MALKESLERSTLFANLSDADLRRLEAAMVRRRYADGQVIFHMGDEGGSLYLITRGRVKVTIPSLRGEEVILAILSAGEILGELSLIDGKPRSATVQALEDAEVLCLPRSAFLSFLRARFETVLVVLEVISRRLRETDRSLADAHFLDLRPRLAKKILDLARTFGVWEEDKVRIGVRVTQKDLAAMVGATRESVNKQFTQLRRRELVQLENCYITVLDPVRLAGRARAEAADVLPFSENSARQGASAAKVAVAAALSD
jgi:CRP/FNR family cyclic AMP-dependent transcriptional regulator